MNSLKSFCIGSVAVQFYPWFIFDFPLFGGYYWKVIFLNNKSLNACIRILLVVKIITYGVML